MTWQPLETCPVRPDETEVQIWMRHISEPEDKWTMAIFDSDGEADEVRRLEKQWPNWKFRKVEKRSFYRDVE